MTVQRRRVLVLPLLAALAVVLSTAPNAAGAPVFPCTSTWEGSTGDWGTATAWNPDGVPGNTSVVCIPSGQVTLSSGAGALGIQLTGTGKLIVSDASLTVYNPSGGPNGPVSLDANTTLQEAGASSSISGGDLMNAGTVQIASGGTRALNFATITNTGTLDVDETTGIFPMDSPTITNTGTIDIAATKRLSAAALALHQAAGQITGGGEFDLHGSSISHTGGDVGPNVTVGIASGSIDASGTGTAAYTVGLAADSPGSAGGTTLSGDIASGKTLRVRGGEFDEPLNSAKLILNADRTNNGAIVLDSLNPSGPNATVDVGTHTLTNNGTITVQGNTGSRSFTGASGTLANTSTGALHVNRDTTFEPSVTNAGAVDVAGVVTATFANHDYTQTAGSTAGAGTVDPTGAGTVALQGGVLGGNGTVDGNLNNTGGDVSPCGSPSAPCTLTVTGNYTQTSGTLTTDITGAAAFDRLLVGGNATLGGTIKIASAGFTPGGADTFDVLQATGSLFGSFTTETGLSAGGRTYDVTYVNAAPGKVRLTVVPRFTLTVSKSGNGSGSVSSNPAGIDCGPDCTQDYDPTATVTLSATPAAGSTFTGWSGSGCSGTGTCQVSMSAVRSVTAAFTQTDADGDGSPQLEDCNDNDAAIRPGATETPGNAVDENCDGVAAPLPVGATNGDDTITGTAAGETICGLLGNDVINALGGNDLVFGDNCGVKAKLARATAGVGGNDTVDGGTGNDTIYGAGGADKLTGGDGNDKLFGGGGNDVLSGGKGNDALDGGKGNDKLTGGPGVNKYSGGDGNDSINAKNGKKETVNCGAGKKDSATVDKADKVKGCEKVKRAKK